MVKRLEFLLLFVLWNISGNTLASLQDQFVKKANSL